MISATDTMGLEIAVLPMTFTIESITLAVNPYLPASLMEILCICVWGRVHPVSMLGHQIQPVSDFYLMIWQETGEYGMDVLIWDVMSMVLSLM
jgi:hypothetical protein